MKSETRREFLKNAALLTGSTLILANCGVDAPDNERNSANNNAGSKDENEEKEVTAAEDLMREHGILRRALIVYGSAAQMLRKDAASVPPNSLVQTAQLFRTFGEDYHEKQLEEAFIFPALKQKGGEPAAMAAILETQHNRGREITDYISAVAGGGKIRNNAAQLADTLDAFVRMYLPHAAREDTVIFPAWKADISSDQYKEMSEKFEDIEHSTFGEDGFDDALKKIAAIEESLRLTDIAQFTASVPPAIK